MEWPSLRECVQLKLLSSLGATLHMWDERGVFIPVPWVSAVSCCRLLQRLSHYCLVPCRARSRSLRWDCFIPYLGTFDVRL